MKKSLFSLIFATLLTGVFCACKNQSGISVKVTESDKEFKFFAIFPDNKTEDVRRFISQNVGANRVSASENRSDVPIKLADGTRFLLRSEAGEVVIRLSKVENSAESLSHIKKLCEGIKKEILD